MKRLLMIALSFLLVTSIYTTGKDTFFSEVKDGYATFEVVENYDGDDYSLMIIKGINKNRSSLGVYFRSVCEDEYYAAVADSHGEYLFKLNDNREVYYPAMAYNTTLEVRIYNCDKELIDELVIWVVDATTFIGTPGGNKGISFSSPKRLGGISETLIIVYIVAISIIALCAIIIIALKIGKKGMFNEEKRQEFIKEFKTFEDQYVNQELHEAENVYDVPKDDYVVEEKVEQVYTRTRDYDDELDDSRPSVKSLLSDRGFNTNYSELSVEEKNKIMIELMMMRDQMVINNNEYQHEIVELWKK